MPFVQGPRDEKTGQILPELILYASSVSVLQGMITEVEGRFLPETAFRWLSGMITSGSGRELRPAPGQRAACDGWSHRHPGVLNGAIREPISGLSIWVGTNRVADQQIISVHCHDVYKPGTAEPHDYPDEAMLVDGLNLSNSQRIYRQYAPLVVRDATTGKLVMGAGAAQTLLFSSVKASWCDWQATPRYPAVKVLASDGNFVQVIEGIQEAPGIQRRQLGFNPPSRDIIVVRPFDVDSQPNIGPSVKARLKGSTGTGPAGFTDNPDEVWSIVNGTEIELDVSEADFLLRETFDGISRLFAAIPVANGGGTFVSAKFEVYGTGIDEETREDSYSNPANPDIITITGLSVPKDASGATSTKWLWVNWSKNYTSAKRYRRDRNNPDGYEYPTFKFFNAGTAVPTRILFHRAGKPLNEDGVPTQWYHAYQWERDYGGASTKGGHSGTFDQYPITVPPNNALEFGSFSPPYESEFPNFLIIALLQFNTDVITADESGGVFNAFHGVRRIPIQQLTTPTVDWWTNTGYPAHDIELSLAVAHSFFDSTEIVNLALTIPGRCVALGGAQEVNSWKAMLFASKFPRRALASLTFTNGSVNVTSTITRFFGWFLGREIVVNGDVYSVRNITIENPALTATLQLTVPYDGPSQTVNCYLAEQLDIIRFTANDGVYGEVNPLKFFIQLPQSDKILSFRPYGDYAIVYGERANYLIRMGDDFTNFKQENVVPPTIQIRALTRDFGAAGTHASEEAKGNFYIANGKGVAAGFDLFNMEYVTSGSNEPLFSSILDSSTAGKRHLVFDLTKEHLLLTNCESLSPTFGREVELGVLFDVHNSLALSVLHPWLARAAGKFRAAKGIASLSARRRRSQRTDFRHGAIVLFVDVYTVDPDGGGLVTTKYAPDGEPDPYIIVYDTLSGVWTALYVGHYRNDAPNTISTMAPQFVSGNDLEPLPGTHFTFQTTDGKIICAYGVRGTPDVSFDTPYMEIVRLVRDDDTGIWSIESVFEGATTTNLNQAWFAGAAAKDGSFYVLQKAKSSLYASEVAMILAQYDDDAIRGNYVDGSGSRVSDIAVGANSSFTFPGHTLGTKILWNVLVDSSHAINLFGYASGNLYIRRLSPDDLLPIAPDVVLALSDPGSTANAEPGGAAPGSGPYAFAANRHGWLFWAERKGSTSGGVPLISLNRYRPADKNFAGDHHVYAAISNLATPLGFLAICVDQRQQLWAAHSDTISAVRVVKVLVFAEGNTPLSFSPIYLVRAGYHRDLVSMAAYDNAIWYLVKDTPTGGGNAEYSIIKTIGLSYRTYDGGVRIYTGDGRPDIVDPGGVNSEEEEAAISWSEFFRLSTKIAGTTGRVSYAAIDCQMEQGCGQPDQANATAMIANWGVVSQ